jgi:5-methylcytosine-specific restriction protein A
MPYTPGTRCSDPQCGAMATYNGKCDTHKRKPWENPSANTLTLTSHERTVFRRAVLTRDPYCVRCGEPATEADHIVEIADGGAHTDINNGQGLCHPCHQEKTNAARTARHA